MELQIENLLVKLAGPVASDRYREREDCLLWLDDEVGDGEGMPLEGGNVLALQQDELTRLDRDVRVDLESEENRVPRR